MANQSNPMEEEIHSYLLTKLKRTIESAKSTENTLSKRLFNLHQELESLADLLKPGAFPAVDDSKRREKIYQLNNLITEWQLLSKKQGIRDTPEALRFSYGLSKSLKKIRSELAPNLDSQQDSARQGSVVDLGTDQSSAKLKSTPVKIHGFEKEQIFLERLLIEKDYDEKFRAIAIVGMAGAGKSTLCQAVLDNGRVRKRFIPRIRVCMSGHGGEGQDFRVEIVKRLLRGLGVEDRVIGYADQDPNANHQSSNPGDPNEVSERLRRLLFALRVELRGKRYLIVLDGVGNLDDFFDDISANSANDKKYFEQLVYGLPKGSGGAVIVTSRSEETAKKTVGDENVHQLALLKGEDCWEIFKDQLDEKKEVPQDLEELKELIIEKSDGLPLAAKMMGQILSEQLPEKQQINGNTQNHSP